MLGCTILGWERQGLSTGMCICSGTDIPIGIKTCHISFMTFYIKERQWLGGWDASFI